MKKIQSVLCALALAISLSSTVLAGDIHTKSVRGDIHTANGILVSDASASGILLSDVFTWDVLTGILVTSFGVVLCD
jgi:hypothetical protein